MHVAESYTTAKKKRKKEIINTTVQLALHLTFFAATKRRGSKEFADKQNDTEAAHGQCFQSQYTNNTTTQLRSAHEQFIRAGKGCRQTPPLQMWTVGNMIGESLLACC